MGLGGQASPSYAEKSVQAEARHDGVLSVFAQGQAAGLGFRAARGEHILSLLRESPPYSEGRVEQEQLEDCRHSEEQPRSGASSQSSEYKVGMQAERIGSGRLFARCDEALRAQSRVLDDGVSGCIG